MPFERWPREIRHFHNLNSSVSAGCMLFRSILLLIGTGCCIFQDGGGSLRSEAQEDSVWLTADRVLWVPPVEERGHSSPHAIKFTGRRVRRPSQCACLSLKPLPSTEYYKERDNQVRRAPSNWGKHGSGGVSKNAENNHHGVYSRGSGGLSCDV